MTAIFLRYELIILDELPLGGLAIYNLQLARLRTWFFAWMHEIGRLRHEVPEPGVRSKANACNILHSTRETNAPRTLR